MEPRAIDLVALRRELRRLPRGQLLRIAEHAAEHLAEVTLEQILSDYIQLPRLNPAEPAVSSPLDQVRTFRDASLKGEYFESFRVNSSNCTDQSSGTDAFMAEFDRLIGLCQREAADGLLSLAREGFEALFELLRRIDDDPDSVVFFADDAGSWQIPVRWEAVLPSYFRCIASDMPAETFASTVDRTIANHCHYKRPELLAAADAVANADQRSALQRLPTGDGRR